ncbi:MAG TPA: V-type ATP synthase subunit I [Gammaproteobacteria bacterium]|jgi:V/A-type H+-transporting ATPase subunit I|nr:V-type ATP synthase subunit I [Gammaproteobacteria bacterium]
MSILSLYKATLCGLSADKDRLLRDLQSLGCLHLIALQPPAKTPEAAPPQHAEDAYKALRYLDDVRRPRRQVTAEADFDFEQVVNKALSNMQRLRRTEEQRDFLLKRIQELAPWGSFVFPPADAMAGQHLWFYQIPGQQMADIGELGYPWQLVHKDTRYAYIAIIAEEEPPAEVMPVPRTHTGAVSLDALRRELYDVEVTLEEIAAEHESLSRWTYLLRRNLARAEDQAALKHAHTQIVDDDGVCLLQGWLPQRDLGKLEQFADERGLVLTAEEPAPDDTPPTLMDNPAAVSGGQDLVSFYQTPAYTSWDPSGIVFFSFALFFAMILADAGYTLVLGGLLAYFWKRMGSSETGIRLRRLSVTVLGTSLVYGVLVGGYFGVAPPADSWLAGLQLLDLNDFDSMMRLSIIIGCLHLTTANAMIAYRAGGFPANAQPLGWISAIVGGLLLWLGNGDGVSIAFSLGVVMLITGLGLVFGFASQRAMDSPKTVLLRGLDGLRALTRVTTLFGDVLSYLRLFALGLASSSLAMTFNQLATQVQEAMPGPGLLLAIIVLLVGHVINLALGIVSGFVHGLRLNFIEFFNWGISEEGHPFRAFAKKEIKP